MKVPNQEEKNDGVATGPAPVPSTADEKAPLGELLAEGAARIAAADPAPPIKRTARAGRPPGRKDAKPRKPGSGMYSRDDVHTAQAQAGAVPGPETPATPPPGTYLEASKFILGLIGTMAAAHFKSEKFKLSPPEIAAVAPLGDAAMIKYMPNSGFDDPLALLCVTLGGLYFQKWTEFQAELAAKKSAEEKAAA